MDKRFLLFLVLAAAILILTPRFFPPPSTAGVTSASDTARADTQSHRAGADTTRSAAAEPAQGAKAPGVPVEKARPAPAGAPAETAAAAPAAPVAAETVAVAGRRTTYRFSTLGAAPVGVQLNDYRALANKGGLVPRDTIQLIRPGLPLLSYGIVRSAGDTLRLERVQFTVDSSALKAGGAGALTFRGTGAGEGVTLVYTFAPDSYLVRVSGQATGGAAGRTLVVTLPEGLNSQEADTVDDQRHFSWVVKPVHRDPSSTAFGKLDTTDARVEEGPLRWIAAKSKYFVIALLTDSSGTPFGGAVLKGLPSTGKQKANAFAVTTMPLPADGRFAFEMYNGPQEWRRLLALGRDFENVNPYGGWSQKIVQPFATIVMQILLWMHDHLRLGYGWVLVIFGVAVRVILWPLNQSAMRAQLKMQRIQPELQALQRKYKTQPDKQQAEMMRLYKEHGMSPFSPLMGCLPMLIPMPVLFALYFVFLNTIEFRGVPFLWMADISQKDPYYILPVAMGVSMFVLSWIGLRTSPPNQQAKMMAYMMPVVMAVLFANFAAGLNLYYAVQNLAALPQQWLIARERAKAAPAAAAPAGSSG